ncbi:MAG TPA: zinc ribbon domain-containing protein [Blastocatellia bacterium]|nr:zinc ribbon domain-containing protein [Blastocatellia bacterium]HMV85820.1 zinc ribbon domain-containing protein [Blastocatellia bacterium]HMY71389.1 zinc ribbon domain-containing protein [Blastocatellia bacterium]HMZ19534.1 zinc ribbon domain-containing protein [Blastocatellia bacterium]HNG31110.1 zinc ribbon domain-containing protein [Blastocatellia bacterium]
MNTTSTATLDHCLHCQAVIHDRDHYCRHCGVELEARTALLAGTGDIGKRSTAELILPASAYITAPLARPDARRPVSGSLLKLMAEETAPAVVVGGNRRLRLLTLALISLPIWLMIVLLSPLDAYAATKAVGRRM